MPARRSATLLRLALILSLASLLIIQFAAPAWAWGRVGHRVIAKLAERHLTDQAKAEIRELLEPGESLAPPPICRPVSAPTTLAPAPISTLTARWR